MRDIKRLIDSPWLMVAAVGFVLIVMAVLAWKAATMDAVHRKIDSIKAEVREGNQERERMEEHLRFIDKREVGEP